MSVKNESIIFSRVDLAQNEEKSVLTPPPLHNILHQT